VKLWVGWDGSWVLSRQKLVVQHDGDVKYLAPRVGMCMDLGDGYAPQTLFGHLRLKKYDTVRVDVTVRRAPKAKR
jgi:hypothetical protein